MSNDRRMIETIKQNLAEKHSTELQEIVQSDDGERWSEEAVVAAREVLLDRAEGRAQEPAIKEPQPAYTPITFQHRLKRLARFVPFILGGLLGLGLAESGLIVRVTTEYPAVVIDLLDFKFPKREELPSHVKVQLLGTPIYEAVGSATEVNDKADRILGVARSGFGLVGAALGLIANALAWKFIVPRRDNVGEPGPAPDRGGN